MLRRYNSTNLDTIVLKGRRTTIGSAPNCDIVLKGKGIAPIHASIESNSAGYFLKDISLSSKTRVNDKPVFGQVQIQSGDLIQVGSSPPLVFDSEWMFGTRPSSAKHVPGKVPTAPPIPEESSTMLPMITGKKIHPLSQQASLSDSSLKKRNAYSKIGKDLTSERSSASSTESHTRSFYNNSRSIGNNLLQRVVKLQAEVIAKDEKIRQLTSQSFHPNLLYYHPSLPPPPLQLPPQLPPPLSITQQAGPPPPPSTILSHRSSNNPVKPPKSFELFAYRAFVGAITSQLRQFNDRVIRHPQRDSAELFNAMCRAVDVPLSSRIGDIVKYCEAVLIDNDFEDGDELMNRLETFIRESRREKILELTNELEVLMPLIRDAASNARENIKVCNVFTQWSRGFGDLLRKNSFSATTLFQAIEDLKTQFSEAHMSRHWLPPSITPILRLAALELEKRDGDITPSISPRPPAVLDRKKSIDMTLDTCLSQVETIIHEMDYHLVRLYNKAKDYSSFQTLDLDTVTRISKIVESMKSSVDLLSEHSFKDERPNSVMFFEITNDDIKNTIRKSSPESSSGSLGSTKKVSVAPKITEVFSEDDEIMEERKEVESEIMKIIGKIGEKIGADGTEEPMRNQGMISVDASVLKTLIQQSQRLLTSYEANNLEEMVRRKRSAPPIIFVDDQDSMDVPEVVPVEPEMVEPVEDQAAGTGQPEVSESPEEPDNLETPEEATEGTHEFHLPEGAICSKPVNPDGPPPEDDPSPEATPSPSAPLEESEEPEDSAVPSDPSEPENPTERSEPQEITIQVPPLILTTAADGTTPVIVSPRDLPSEEEIVSKILAPEESNFGLTSSETDHELAEPPELPEAPAAPSRSSSEDVDTPKTPDFPTPKHIASGSDLPFTLIMPEQPTNPPGSETGSFEDVRAPEPIVEEPDEDSEEEIDPEDEEEELHSDEEEEEHTEEEEHPGIEEHTKAKEHLGDRHPEEEEHPEGVNDDSETESDDKITMIYIPSAATPQELTPQSSQHSDDPPGRSMELEEPEEPQEPQNPVAPEEEHQDPEESHDEDQEIGEETPILPHITQKPLSNGHVLRESMSEDRMSSHLRSHFNTANGKPHITYQYPIRRYFSPPMKRRSKSEDQKIRDTLKNRPPFVLY